MDLVPHMHQIYLQTIFFIALCFVAEFFSEPEADPSLGLRSMGALGMGPAGMGYGGAWAGNAGMVSYENSGL